MKKLLFLLLFPLIVFGTPLTRTYTAKVISVYDGDTFTCEIDLGLDLRKKEVIRLRGVDCPELSSAEGKSVAKIVNAMLEGKDVLVQTQSDDRDKYGRLLAIVFVNNVNLNTYLLEKKMAKSYKGGAR
jgi:micrococcal nuclease